MSIHIFSFQLNMYRETGQYDMLSQSLDHFWTPLTLLLLRLLLWRTSKVY